MMRLLVHDARRWWRRHWWPSVIRQKDQEITDWKRWCENAERKVGEMDELIVSAWGIIANAYDGDWDRAKNTAWQPAAVRWRERYHRYLDGRT